MGRYWKEWRRENILELSEELHVAVVERFNLNIKSAEYIDYGWLNHKWKVSTEKGEFLLKQYSKKRYAGSRLDDLHTALQQQNRLQKAGLPCPKLLTSESGVLHFTASGESFSIMTYVQGKMLKTNQISMEQASHLGCVTGEMHRLLNDGALIAKDKPLFILPSKEERMNHWDKLEQKAKEDRNHEMLDLLKLHKKAANQMNMNLLISVETGWAHRDLWTDNILFKENGVSAILDFDRMHYDYPEMDVARALLSFCLVEDHFDTLLSQSFLSGYRSVLPFSEVKLTRSMLLVYWLESEWWISDRHSSKTTIRFKEEMNWLANQVQFEKGRYLWNSKPNV